MVEIILREPTLEELELIEQSRLHADQYYVVENDSNDEKLVCLHKTRGRRRTIKKGVQEKVLYCRDCKWFDVSKKYRNGRYRCIHPDRPFRRFEKDSESLKYPCSGACKQRFEKRSV